MATKLEELHEVFTRHVKVKAEADSLHTESEVLVAQVEGNLAEAERIQERAKSIAVVPQSNDMNVLTAALLADANSSCERLKTLLADLVGLSRRTQEYSSIMDDKAKAELARLVEQ